jgi:phage/plasmid-associated DNA primase
MISMISPWGLQPPDFVLEATRKYRQEQDPCGDFFGRVCEVGAEFRVSRKALKQAFLAWFRGNNPPLAPMPTEGEFTKLLRDRGYETRNSAPNGSAEVYGLQLRAG